MSSYANGCMIVVLPEYSIGEFERFFDQDNENSFLNTEITLTDSDSADRAGYLKRIYDISCNTSLEACLIENEEYDIRDVCFELGIAELDIDARNDDEDIDETITFNDKERVYHYDSDAPKWETASYDIKGKTEAEAE